jgi:ADP-ribose pyrophosphatase
VSLFQGNSSQVSAVLPCFTLQYLFVHRITYTDPEGTQRDWEASERLTRPKGSDIDGVGVVAILQDPSKPDQPPRILLQKQWRPPVNATVIEVPAGLIDPKETPEVCAVRELKEETGYVGEVVSEGFGVSPIMFNGEFLIV